MAHERKIKLSAPLHRHYNVVGVHKEDDLALKFDFSEHLAWKDQPYQITIYNEADRSPLISTGFDADEVVVTITDYNFGSIRAVVVVEDRTDPNNIDAIETVGYIFFKDFPGGVERTLEGHAEYEEADGNILTIPYYSTGFITS